MITVVTISVVAVCFVVGMVRWYRDPANHTGEHRTTADVDRERLERHLERDRTLEKAEEELQRRQRPPTHEEP